MQNYSANIIVGQVSLYVISTDDVLFAKSLQSYVMSIVMTIVDRSCTMSKNIVTLKYNRESN